MSLCPWTDRLDPRPVGDAQSEPFHRSVNIPLAEMASRVFELPPKGSHLVLPSLGEVTLKAQEWLSRRQITTEVIPFEPCLGTEQYRLWKPNAFLMDCVAGLSPGAALDLGCGCGREVVALAAEGWRVDGVDHLPDALDLGRQLLSRYSPDSVDRVSWHCGDVLRGSSFDSTFDLVYAIYFYDQALWSLALSALKVGGRLVIESFSPQHRELYSKPDLDRVIIPDEVHSLAQGFEVERMAEAVVNGRHVVQAVARKTG